jgi:hypothetical protein
LKILFILVGGGGVGTLCIPSLMPNQRTYAPVISDLQMLFRTVADPGCLSRIPDPNFFHPGYRIGIKEFNYFKPKKWFLCSRNMIWACYFFYPSRIPAPGSRGQKGTGSGSATQLFRMLAWLRVSHRSSSIPRQPGWSEQRL